MDTIEGKTYGPEKKERLFAPHRPALLLYVFVSLLLVSAPLHGSQERIAASDQGAFQDRIVQGIRLIYNRQLVEAGEEFRSFIHDNPDDPAGYFYLAMVSWSYLSNGFWSDAMVKEYGHRIDEAIYSSTEAESLLLHIYLFLEEDYVKARPIAKDLATRFGENPRYKYLEGLCYLKANREEDFRAAAHYLYGLGQDAASSEIQRGLWRRRAMYLEASEALFKEACPKARHILDHIISMTDPATDPAMIAWPILKKGMSFDLEGNRDSALRHYRSVQDMGNGAGAQFLAEKYTESPVKKKIPSSVISVRTLMKRFFFSLCLLCLIVTPLLGCTRLALRLSPSLIGNFATTTFEECDVPLARNAIPANLMLLEGLLKNDPKNPKVLSSLAMGFTGYSLLFVEEEDPARASRLYERAWEYALHALGDRKLSASDSGGPESVEIFSKEMGQDAFEPLFWYTMAWTAWINLNLDKPIALSHLGATRRLTERLIVLNGSYMHGLPHVLLGTTLAALPPLLGGKPDQAKEHFEKALTLSQGRFFLVQYYYARYYAVRVQNRALFMHLIDEILSGSPKGMGDVCLINAVVQQKAQELEQRVDDLFI